MYPRLISLILFLFSANAFATPGTFVYQGQITKADGNPLVGSPTTFLVQVLSPTNDCVLYEETHAINIPASAAGVFSLAIGNGSRTGSGFEDLSSLVNVYNNAIGNMAGLTCTSGSSYNPGVNDRRKIRLTYDDGSGPVTIAADHQVQSVPFSWHAYTLRGLTPANFVQINPAVNLTQSNLENLLTGSGYANLLSLASGTNTDYVQTGASGAEMPSLTADPSSPAAGAIWYNSTSGQLKFHDGSTTHILGSSSTVATSVDASTGTPAAPSISFTTEADTGFYNSNPNAIGIATGGAQIFEFNTAGLQSPTTGGALVRTALGSNTAPVFSFTGDTDTGWYNPAADVLAAATNSVERLRIDANGRVGIGSASPTGPLDVQGGTAPASVAGGAIRLVAQTSGSGSAAAGGTLQLSSGAGSGVGAGGTVAISAGAGGVTGPGGPVNITAGNAPGTGTGGAINITAGNGTGGGANHGGTVTITAGTTNSSGSGTPGVLNLLGGTASPVSSNKTGGTINITAGTGAASGTGGTVNITGGTSGATGAGGAVNITGGTTVAGAGGNVTVSASSAAGTNQNGGNLTFNAGAATGTGTAGAVLFPTGNVGINTANPQHRLHVEGQIYATSVVAGNIYSGNTPRPFATTGTATSANYWFRMARVELDAQYQAYAFTIDIQSAVVGTAAINARVAVSIMQNAAMGLEPEVTVDFDSATTLLRSSDVVAVKNAAASLSTVDIYMRTQNNWQSVYYIPSASSGWHKIHDYEPGALVAALPSGTQVAARGGLALWGMSTSASTIYYNGSVGIGTTTPDNVRLEVSGPQRGPAIGIPGKYPWNLHSSDPSAMAIDVGGGIGFQGRIDGSTTQWTFSGIHGGKENATSGNHAGYLSFHTRSNGAHESERVRISSGGNVGIGTTAPQAVLDVRSNALIGDHGGAGAFNASAPLTVRRNTEPHLLLEDIGDVVGGLAVSSAGTTLGTELGDLIFRTGVTYTGSFVSTGSERMRILANGNVSIGPATVTDKLHVVGDVRVGTAGANGCIKDFGGGTVAGTCSSDERLKKNIRAVASVSEKLSRLSPKFYEWRAEEFPERGYGDQTELGLVAQEVMSVLPDMVERDEDGLYKVRYQRLPFYLLKGFSEHHGALTEMKKEISKIREENSSLKRENDALKKRLDAIEKKLGL